jgi:putative oxidoreductase
MSLRMGTFSQERLECNRFMLDRFKSSGWAAVPLRLIVGFGFVEHGYAKLVKGPEAFASILHALSVPFPHLMAWLTILTELFGGLAVLLGVLLPWVSLPMAAVLLAAVFEVHWRYGFSSIKLIAITPEGARFGQPGYECDLLYLSCLAALVLSGPGKFSLQGTLSKERSPR